MRGIKCYLRQRTCSINHSCDIDLILTEVPFLGLHGFTFNRNITVFDSSHAGHVLSIIQRPGCHALQLRDILVLHTYTYFFLFCLFLLSTFFILTLLIMATYMSIYMYLCMYVCVYIYRKSHDLCFVSRRQF